MLVLEFYVAQVGRLRLEGALGLASCKGSGHALAFLAFRGRIRHTVLIAYACTFPIKSEHFPDQSIFPLLVELVIRPFHPQTLHVLPLELPGRLEILLLHYEMQVKQLVLVGEGEDDLVHAFQQLVEASDEGGVLHDLLGLVRVHAETLDLLGGLLLGFGDHVHQVLLVLVGLVFLGTDDLVKELQRDEVFVRDFQLVEGLVRHYKGFLPEVELLDFAKQLHDVFVVGALVLLLDDEVGDVVEGEEVLVEDALGSDYLGELLEQVVFLAARLDLQVEDALEVFDLQDLRGLWQLAQEGSDNLLLFLSAIQGLNEVVVVNHTRDDLVFVNVEVVLVLLKGSSNLLPMFKHPLLEPFEFILPPFPHI